MRDLLNSYWLMYEVFLILEEKVNTCVYLCELITLKG